MKKLLALSLLASFAQAYCNTEKPAQTQPQNIVQLTEKEKIIRCKLANEEIRMRDKIANDPGPIPITLWLHRESVEYLLIQMLHIGCGLNELNQSDSYDSNEYPECKKTLEFLKAYGRQMDTQREQNKEFAEQFYNKMKVQLQEAQQN